MAILYVRPFEKEHTMPPMPLLAPFRVLIHLPDPLPTSVALSSPLHREGHLPIPTMLL
jgi:hypothetical protein